MIIAFQFWEPNLNRPDKTNLGGQIAYPYLLYTLHVFLFFLRFLRTHLGWKFLFQTKEKWPPNPQTLKPKNPCKKCIVCNRPYFILVGTLKLVLMCSNNFSWCTYVKTDTGIFYFLFFKVWHLCGAHRKFIDFQFYTIPH